MFQRSFTQDDDMEEDILQEVANDWEDTPPENSSGQYHGTVRPSKRSFKDCFSR